MPRESSPISLRRSVPQILVLAKDIRQQGGYYEFVSLLLNRQQDEGALEYFRIGRPVGDDSVLGMIWSIPFDQCRLATRLLRKSYDCLLFNTSMNITAFIRDTLLIMMATLFTKNRIVIQVHGWQESFARSIGAKWPLRALFAASFRKADCIIVLASRFKEQLTSLGVAAQVIRVGSTMFDGKLFTNSRRSDTGPPRLLFLSRLTREKGAFETLDALRMVRERHPDVELVMAGDGPDREALQAHARTLGLASVVRFPGFVRGDAKAELLMSSDIFLLPTRYGEGLPISILEALAAGMVVIATRAGGIGEILVDGKHGVLLRSNEPSEICAAVNGLLADPEGLRRIGLNNKSFAWSRFEAGSVSKEIVRLCRASSIGYA
jgi:glycosyltransferase involved in cell wall biosynthesis